MNKSKSLKELKKLIVIRYEDNAESIECYKNNENPQIKKIFDRARIENEVLKDVIQYIDNGERWQFELYK